MKYNLFGWFFVLIVIILGFYFTTIQTKIVDMLVDNIEGEK
jgi:hypothetical protein